ncbi:hypothetical protein MRB53_002167 [Persea americana]|uniref:Uncharacterized protein n=1 Tax=Persea americana TaxID=3435 RepID=A0ACC2MTY9_PERAE|nr:hypothetical protein MRB53_002167 [Persea americana]
MKTEPEHENSTPSESVKKKQPLPKVVIIADLNVDPPASDGDDCLLAAKPDPSRNTTDGSIRLKTNFINKENDAVDGADKSFIKLGKYRSRVKGELVLESGPDADGDPHCQGTFTSREEKVSSFKAGLVHVARKMPKNAHAHFILGLMYQRLGQPQKAVLAYEKSSEILRQCDEEVGRPELLSVVQIHHAQCLLQGNTGDSSDKEFEAEELDDLLLKLKDSVQSDIRQAAVWNTLGLILLRTGRLQSAVSILSALLADASDNLDALANLGLAYLQSGNLELSAKCFQDLILKDQNHPAALINFAAFLLCKYGSVIPGAGTNAAKEFSASQFVAANVAKDCLEAAVKADSKSGYIWVNLANAYSMVGDNRSAAKCLEKGVRLDPNRMSIRYAIALHRIKDAERSLHPTEQLSWAANEMASILREGDPTLIELHIAWAGLAMVHKAQHEIATTFEDEQKNLSEVEERALYTLKQAIEEDPDDAVQWNQLGLHNLCTLQFKTSQKYLKTAVAFCRGCSYIWSNLGVSLQLSGDLLMAEKVYKRALTFATPQQAHSILSNLGNLYRQQQQFEKEGMWEDAKSCFGKALEADPLLDAAKSNMMKAAAMSRSCAAKETYLAQEKL